MESKLQGKTYSFGEVLRSTIQLSKGNYAQLFTVNILIVIMSLFPTTMNEVIAKYIPNPIFMILGSMTVFVISIILFYFISRVTILQLYNVYDYIHDLKTSFEDQYTKAGKVTWKYIGTSLLIALMIAGIYIVFAIVLAVYAGLNFASNDGPGIVGIVAMVIFGLIALGGMIFISIKFYLAVLVRVFQPENSNYFQESFMLVRGKFFTILGLFMVPGVIQIAVIGATVFLMIQGFISNLVYMGIAGVLSLVMGPFVITGMVVMYLLLVDDNNEGEE